MEMNSVVDQPPRTCAGGPYHSWSLLRELEVYFTLMVALAELFHPSAPTDSLTVIV
jgi:hypothetical protein